MRLESDISDFPLHFADRTRRLPEGKPRAEQRVSRASSPPSSLSPFSHAPMYLAWGEARCVSCDFEGVSKKRVGFSRVAVCVPVGVSDFLIGRLGLSTAGESEFSKTNKRIFVFSFSDFTVSLFSLSFVIVRERAPESHSAGSVCHLRRRRPWCAVKKASAIWGALRVGNGLPGLVLIEWRLVPKEPPI